MGQIQVRTPNLKSISVGKLQAKYSADGSRVLRYFIDFWHNEMGLHKELSAPEVYLLQGKIDALMATWDKRLAEHRRRSTAIAAKEVADQMTLEAATKREALSGILRHTLLVSDRVNWEALMDRSTFPAPPVFSTPEPTMTCVYRQRNAVKRFFNKLKHFRAVVTRYDKRDDNFLASVQLASIRI